MFSTSTFAKCAAVVAGATVASAYDTQSAMKALKADKCGRTQMQKIWHKLQKKTLVARTYKTEYVELTKDLVHKRAFLNFMKIRSEITFLKGTVVKVLSYTRKKWDGQNWKYEGADVKFPFKPCHVRRGINDPAVNFQVLEWDGDYKLRFEGKKKRTTITLNFVGRPGCGECHEAQKLVKGHLVMCKKHIKESNEKYKNEIEKIDDILIDFDIVREDIQEKKMLGKPVDNELVELTQTLHQIQNKYGSRKLANKQLKSLEKQRKEQKAILKALRKRKNRRSRGSQ